MRKHAWRLWGHLAGAPVEFDPSSVRIVVSPQSLLCPPSWVGLVELAGAAIVTVPDETCAGIVRAALDGLPAATVTDPSIARRRLPVVDMLGPATLAYCDARQFRRPEPGAPTVEVIPGSALAPLLASVSTEDADEAGLDEITSPAFVLRSGADVVAAAGYRRWPCDTAHLSVLTAARHRGRGFARAVAGAAVAEALAAGLTPQWRARPEPSRRVARALGFDEIGSQLSVRLASPSERV